MDWNQKQKEIEFNIHSLLCDISKMTVCIQLLQMCICCLRLTVLKKLGGEQLEGFLDIVVKFGADF